MIKPILQTALLTSLILTSCTHQKRDAKQFNLEHAETLNTARFHFNSAMRDWKRARKGVSGTLLFYYRSHGPLSREFEQLVETGQGRNPVEWTIECVRCSDLHNCEIFTEVKFDANHTSQMRRFELMNTGFFVPLSDYPVEMSPKQKAEIDTCRTENRTAFDTLRQQSLSDNQTSRN